jgi:hypothetical protein
MPEEKNVVEINPDAAAQKTKNFFRRHKTKLSVAALTALAAGSFVAGRRSKDLVESVDVEINLADDNSDN